jgi:hypothetical protein
VRANNPHHLTVCTTDLTCCSLNSACWNISNLIQDCPNVPDHSNLLVPDHSNFTPDCSSLIPNHLNLVPNHSSLCPDHSNVTPDHSSLVSNHSNVAPDHLSLVSNHSNLIPDCSSLNPARLNISNFVLGSNVNDLNPAHPNHPNLSNMHSAHSYVALGNLDVTNIDPTCSNPSNIGLHQSSISRADLHFSTPQDPFSQLPDGSLPPLASNSALPFPPLDNSLHFTDADWSKALNSIH